MQTRHMFMLAVFACGASEPASGQRAIDMRLENAGFVMRPANTPEQLARLKLLPPRKFVARNKAGGRYFLYADPEDCKCVFLGDERAMQSYRDMMSPPSGLPRVSVPPSGASVEHTMIQDMNADLHSTITEGDILDFPN